MNEPVDIICLCSRHGIGGVQKNAARLTNAFRSRGYNAQLGFLFESEPDAVLEVSDHFVLAPRSPKTMREWFQFWRSAIRRLRAPSPEVIFGFSPLANVVGAITAKGSGRFVSRQAWPLSEQSKATALAEYVLRKTSLVHGNIAVSKFVASTFAYEGKSYLDKTKVIYNSPPQLPVAPEDKNSSRELLGMDQGDIVLGCLGRLHEQKNFQQAIKALPLLPSAHLYIAGSGPLRDELQTLVESLDLVERVKFLGTLSGADVTRFYKAVDVLLMPSLYEGHPMVMLEALSQGVLVVANDVPVMREAGGQAVRYAGTDPAEWADSVHQLISSESDTYKRLAAERASYFSTFSMVDQYLLAAGLPPNKR